MSEYTTIDHRFAAFVCTLGGTIKEVTPKPGLQESERKWGTPVTLTIENVDIEKELLPIFDGRNAKVEPKKFVRKLSQTVKKINNAYLEEN